MRPVCSIRATAMLLLRIPDVLAACYTCASTRTRTAKQAEIDNWYNCQNSPDQSIYRTCAAPFIHAASLSDSTSCCHAGSPTCAGYSISSIAVAGTNSFKNATSHACKSSYIHAASCPHGGYFISSASNARTAFSHSASPHPGTACHIHSAPAAVQPPARGNWGYAAGQAQFEKHLDCISILALPWFPLPLFKQYAYAGNFLDFIGRYWYMVAHRYVAPAGHG
jgi:hypothetical protein